MIRSNCTKRSQILKFVCIISNNSKKQPENYLNMKTIDDIKNAVSQVSHPAINYSLTGLGIVADVQLSGNIVNVEFAFPFPKIPIAEVLVNSIAEQVQTLGFDFEHNIRIMNDRERARFMQMEEQAWIG